MTHGPPVKRHDRMDVPATLDTGARRLPVVLARVGVLRYAWGTERVTADVLRDAAFVEALPGLPVQIGIGDTDHPDRVDVGDDGGTVRAGTIVSAEFSEAQQALVGVLVIDTPAGLDAVARGVRGVSLGYSADCDPTAPTDRADGASHVRTRMYAPNHLILTLTPRGGSSVAVRADGGSVDAPDLATLTGRLDSYDSAIAKMGERMDAIDLKLAEALKQWAGEEAAEPEHRADSATAGAWRSVLAAADSRKVKIEDTSTIVDARKAVAGAIIGKERADSLDAAGLDAVILAGATVPRADSWADAFRPAPVSAPADRADAADPLAALLEA